MRSISICLQQWEVQAILDGKKTQLRRLVKPQPTGLIPPFWGEIDQHGWWSCANNTGETWKSPFGQPGDLLLCKESWWPLYQKDGQQGVLYEADRALIMPKFWQEGYLRDAARNKKDGFKTSALMPSWAVRLHGRVKRVWVERVRAIEISDAVASGTEFLDKFEEREPGSWERNDWVWACEFELEVI